eukprot:3887310-Alexandrium_andersonii.AAC.1
MPSKPPSLAMLSPRMLWLAMALLRGRAGDAVAVQASAAVASDAVVAGDAAAGNAVAGGIDGDVKQVARRRVAVAAATATLSQATQRCGCA